MTPKQLDKLTYGEPLICPQIPGMSAWFKMSGHDKDAVIMYEDSEGYIRDALVNIKDLQLPSK